MMRRHVIHVYRDAYPPRHGGIEQHVHTLAHAQKHTDVPSVLISANPAGLRDDCGVPIESTGEWGRFQGAPIAPAFPGAIRRRHPDLFHFHMANPTGELAYLLSRSRVPAVATYHHDIVRQARALTVYRPFLRAFLSRVARILVAAPQHIEVSPILPEFRSRCEVIPYGINLSRFRASPEVLRQAELVREKHGSRIVLFVGKLRYYKGLDILLTAMAGVDGTLLLVGRGTEEASLRRQVDTLGLSERVHFLPHLEDAEFMGVLHAANVFTLPSNSRMEMFGIAQLEAHACGKPVVSTALGTGVEFVNRHGETGLVVPPGDPRALADAIRRLLDEPVYAAELGAAAQARAEREFSDEVMAARTREVYEEVLAA